jgi:hypothetical protein
MINATLFDTPSLENNNIIIFSIGLYVTTSYNINAYLYLLNKSLIILSLHKSIILKLTLLIF